jgi:hypothetical protein
MSKTKTELNTQIDSTIFTNAVGGITAVNHNTLEKDVVDSTVNELEPKVQADLDLQGNDLTNVNALSLSIAPTVPWAEGKVFYDDQNKTLAFYNENSDITIQVGQEQVFKVRNNSGITLSNGDAITVTGSQGNLVTVEKALADTWENARCAGLVTQTSIANNSDGFITLGGIVRGVDTSTFLEGDILYLSETVPGFYVTTPPSISSRVGVVVRSHVNQGEIFVSISNNQITNTDQVSEGTNLYYTEGRVSTNTDVAANTLKISASGSIDTHSDIDISTAVPSEGQELVWRTDKFVPETDAKVSADGSIDTHSDVDISTTAPTDGQVMVWRTSEFVPENPATGTGDVAGPASSIDENIALFDGTTGKLIKDATVNISSVNANTLKVSADGSIDSHSDVDTSTTAPTDGQVLVWRTSEFVPEDQTGGGSGDVIGPASSTDDNLATFDGATGKIIQDGGKAVADFPEINHTDDVLTGKMQLAVVDTLPATPDNSTIYFVRA